MIVWGLCGGVRGHVLAKAALKIEQQLVQDGLLVGSADDAVAGARVQQSGARQILLICAVRQPQVRQQQRRQGLHTTPITGVDGPRS